MSMRSDFDEVGSNGIVDELIVLRDELVKAFLDHLGVCVSVREDQAQAGRALYQGRQVPPLARKSGEQTGGRVEL